MPENLNPFFHRGPVRDPAYFFGRKHEVAYIADLLRAGQSVALNGQRRFGKTSLLFHLANPGVAATHGLGQEATRWVYLDGGGLDGLGMIKKLRAALGEAGEAIVNRRGQGWLLILE